MSKNSNKAKQYPLYKLLKEKFPEYEEKRLYSAILCGEVLVEGGVIKDPKLLVSPLSRINIKTVSFVSRGGEKLHEALKTFSLDIRGKVFIDAGSSTGGFSQCLLNNGAEKVFAVDVGYNQLDYSLRTDSRVVVKERTNIMDIHSLEPRPNAAVADLSFRSIHGAASHILSLTSDKWMIALIKPQFEWTYPPDDFNGIVSGRNNIEMILRDVIDGLIQEGIYPADVTTSPIPGRKGNQEFLFLLRKVSGLSTDEIIGRLL